jgi:hypothetical protein
MQRTLDLRLNLNKNDKKAHVLLFCPNHNHQPSWEGSNIADSVSLGFCSLKNSFLSKNTRKMQTTLDFRLNFNKK